MARNSNSVSRTETSPVARGESTASDRWPPKIGRKKGPLESEVVGSSGSLREPIDGIEPISGELVEVDWYRSICFGEIECARRDWIEDWITLAGLYGL